MKHLEKQFTKGMTWENHGKWHIDHVIPDSHFKYINVEDKEFQECWALLILLTNFLSFIPYLV